MPRRGAAENEFGASNARAGDTPNSFDLPLIHIRIEQKMNKVKKTSTDQNFLGALPPNSACRASAIHDRSGFDPAPSHPISPTTKTLRKLPQAERASNARSRHSRKRQGTPPLGDPFLRSSHPSP